MEDLQCTSPFLPFNYPFLVMPSFPGEDHCDVSLATRIHNLNHVSNLISKFFISTGEQEFSVPILPFVG